MEYVKIKNGIHICGIKCYKCSNVFEVKLSEQDYNDYMYSPIRTTKEIVKDMDKNSQLLLTKHYCENCEK